MGILSRFTDIISSNINALLDKAEDPVKLINQYLIEAKEDLAQVKKETAEVMAQEAAAKRKLDDNTAQVAKYTELAKRALTAGNDDDAKIFIAKKQALENTGASLEVAYAAAHENAQKMRQLHGKLSDDIAKLEIKKEEINAKVAIANTQNKINDYAAGAEKYQATVGKFEQMAEKADKMLDMANATAELNKESEKTAETLEMKYSITGSTAVDDELAALKAELGL